MPAAIVDPSIQAQGPIPASPISGMLRSIVGAYGQQFPNALERSEMQMRNAETQKLTNENAAPQQLQDLFARAYQTQAGNGQPPVVQSGAAPQGGAPQPASAPSRDQLVSSTLPEVVGAMARAGQYGNIGSMFRTLTANAPGITVVGKDAQHPSPVSMSMLGAGDSYTSTPDAALVGATPGQRDRNAKINDMLASNPGITRDQAANVVDGVTTVEIDPTTKNAFLVNKLNKTSELLRSPAQGTSPTAPGNAPAAPAGNPSNNPFNLRPVGATEGFQSYASPQEGMLAGMHDLAVKLSGKSQAMAGKPVTLRNIISTYSPPNENKTDALVKNAAARMGVDPDAVLDINALQPLSQAILAQEQGGTTANAAAPAIAAAAPGFTLKRGDLGIPFGSIYGGPAAVGRMAGGIAALTGNAEANNSSTQGLTNVNDIKNQLIAIKSLQMGMRSNAGAQSRFAQQFPATDPQLLDEGNMAAGATTGSGTAEDQIMRGLQGAVTDRISDAQTLADPNTGAEERQYAQERVNKTDKLFSGLPPSVQEAYRKATGQTELAGPTNLEQGKAATTAPTPGPDGLVKVVGPDGQPYKVPPTSVSAILKAGGKLRTE